MKSLEQEREEREILQKNQDDKSFECRNKEMHLKVHIHAENFETSHSRIPA